jgi:translation initiation factor 2-alpha kinase 4
VSARPEILADPGSFDIVSPLRSAAAEVEMIEVVDKIIAEFRGTSLASEAAGYEFHISHETSKWIQPFSRLTFSVLSSVLSLVPRHKEQVLAAFKSIGKTSDRASTALNRVYTALDQKTANNLKACATAGE